MDSKKSLKHQNTILKILKPKRGLNQALKKLLTKPRQIMPNIIKVLKIQNNIRQC
jgi:hypothetical protein